MSISGVINSIRQIMWQDTGLNGDAQRIEQLGWMLFLKIFCDKDKELELLNDDYISPIPKAYQWESWAANDEGLTGDKLLEFVDRELFPALRNIDISTGNKRAVIVHEVFDGNHNYMKSGINIRKVLNKLNEIDFNKAKDRHEFGDMYEAILKDLQSAGKSGEFYTPRAITQFITDIVNPKIGERILDPACGTAGYLTSAIEHLKKRVKNVEDRQLIQDSTIGWEYKPLPYLLATTNLILHDIEVPNITYRDSLDQPLSEYKDKDRVDVILANPPFGGIVANNNENNFPQNYRTKESADLFLILMIHLLKPGGRAGIVLPDGSLTGDGVKQRVRQKLLEDCNLHTIIRLPNSVFKPYATVATNLLFFEKGAQTKEVWYYQHTFPKDIKSYSKTRPLGVDEFNPIKEWWNNRQENDFAWKVSIDTIAANGYDLDIKNPMAQNVARESLISQDFNRLKENLVTVNEEIADVLNDIFIVDQVIEKTLGELCFITKGQTGIKKAIKGKFPMVTTSEERGTHTSFQFDSPAVCVPLVSSTGHGHASLKRVLYQEGKFALGTILAALQPIDKEYLSCKFLYYYLNSFKDELIVPLMKGMANVGLSVTKIRTIQVKVPPMEQQLKLVSLMEKSELLRDNLKQSLDILNEAMTHTFSEAFAGTNERNEKETIITEKTPVAEVYKTLLLAAEIISQLNKKQTLGHIKLQKLIFLCERTQKMALPVNFLRQAMGPYDPVMQRHIDKELIDRKWFQYDEDSKLKYKALVNAGGHKSDYIKYFGKDITAINHLIQLFENFRSARIEIVATLFACWEELLNKKQLVNDASLLASFYNWSEYKNKYSNEQVINALRWMEEEAITPN